MYGWRLCAAPSTRSPRDSLRLTRSGGRNAERQQLNRRWWFSNHRQETRRHANRPSFTARNGEGTARRHPRPARPPAIQSLPSHGLYNGSGTADMLSSFDTGAIASAVKNDLDLTSRSEQTAYQSVTLCVIDAVYSINVRYEQVTNVVDRYCEEFGLAKERVRNDVLPERIEQDAVTRLLSRMNPLGDEKFARDVFQNSGRTSTKNGILKARAVRLFAEALATNGVEYLQDVTSVLDSVSLERAVKRIPGQGSGISLKYFFMQAGIEELIKPDRMIQHYVESVLHRSVDIRECPELLAGAVADLK